MNDYPFMNLSKDQVLQTAIVILKKNGGSASLEEMYKAFAPVIGHDLNETEASNLKNILDTSTAKACLIQEDGQCCYVNSSNDQTYTLEVNPDSCAKVSASNNTTSMSAALNEETYNQGYTTVPGSSTDPVIEPANMVKNDSAAGIAAQQFGTGNTDEQADADAYAEAARADKEQSRADRKAEKQDGRIEHLEQAIEKQKEKIARHEEQIKKDRTNLMKDLHEKEIEFDEHRIASDQKKIDALEDRIVDEER